MSFGQDSSTIHCVPRGDVAQGVHVVNLGEELVSRVWPQGWSAALSPRFHVSSWAFAQAAPWHIDASPHGCRLSREGQGHRFCCSPSLPHLLLSVRRCVILPGWHQGNEEQKVTMGPCPVGLQHLDHGVQLARCLTHT